MHNDILSNLKRNYIAYQSNCDILNNVKGVYFGIDPSANMLHLGHIIMLFLIKYLYSLGINIYLVIGVGTIFIGGDPSDKSVRRSIIDMSVINNNYNCLYNQLLYIFNNNNIYVDILNNYDWLNNLNYIDFVRNFYTLYSFNRIMSHSFLKDRLKLVRSIGMNEIIYSLIQGYDYYYLFKKYGCNLQVGGYDQIVNMSVGLHFISKKLNHNVDYLAMPLLVNRNNEKVSKTDSNKFSIENNMSISLWYKIRSIDDYIVDYIYNVISLIINCNIVNINDKKIYVANQCISFIYGEQVFSIVDNFIKGYRLSKSDLYTIFKVFDVSYNCIDFRKLLIISGIAISINIAKTLINSGAVEILLYGIVTKYIVSIDNVDQYYIVRCGLYYFAIRDIEHP